MVVRRRLYKGDFEWDGKLSEGLNEALVWIRLCLFAWSHAGAEFCLSFAPSLGLR
jgi:hypothetical protein